MPVLIPSNPLEVGLENLRAGLIQLSDFMPTLIFGEIIAPSGSEPQADGSGFTPLFYSVNGVDRIAAFTSAERVQPIAEHIPHCLVIQAGELLRRMTPEFGLIINPGWSLGLELSPHGIRQIIDAMAETVWET